MAIKRVLFFSDPHIPLHDQRAWNLLLKCGKSFRPDILVCIGDFGDFGAISRHLKYPGRTPSTKAEIIACKEARKQLDALGAKEKVWIKGNHDQRWDDYLAEKAPELVEVLPSLEETLGFPDNGWKVIPYRQHYRLGKLYLTHDVGSSGRYAIFRTLERFEHSVLSGHTHRLAYMVEGNAVGEYKVAATFGWLGDMSKMDYMAHINMMKDWALGFGVGYLNTDNGIVHVVPVPIVKYTAVVEGKLYTS